MRPLLASLALALSTLSGLSAEAHAAPSGISDKAVDVDLNGVEVAQVFAILAQAGGRNVQLDSCVHGKVDIKLQNTPIPMVFDALATKLHLVYEEEAGDVLVRCAGDGGANDARATTRVGLQEKEAPLADVLAKLARSAKLDGVDYQAKTTPKVTVTLDGVRLSTALAVLAEEAGLRIGVTRGKIVVTD